MYLCRANLRGGKDSAKTFAYAELAMEMEEKLATLKAQAETHSLTDQPEAAAMAGAIQ